MESLRMDNGRRWYLRSPPAVRSQLYNNYFLFRPDRELPAALPDVRNTLLVVFTLAVGLFYTNGLVYSDSIYKAHIKCFEIVHCISFGFLAHECIMCIGLNMSLLMMTRLIRNFPYHNVTFGVTWVISGSFPVIVYFLSCPREGEKREQQMNTWITPVCVFALSCCTQILLWIVTRVKEDQLENGPGGQEDRGENATPPNHHFIDMALPSPSPPPVNTAAQFYCASSASKQQLLLADHPKLVKGKTIALIVLDGWTSREDTPTLNSLKKDKWTFLNTHGTTTEDTRFNDYLTRNGVRIFSCRNRSGYMEEYVEIAEGARQAILSREFEQVSVNLPTVAMVRDAGEIEATVDACKAADGAVRMILDAIEEVGGIYLVTADHTLQPAVPLAIGGPGLAPGVDFRGDIPNPGLSNVAATVINLHGFEAPSYIQPSLIHVAPLD